MDNQKPRSGFVALVAVGGAFGRGGGRTGGVGRCALAVLGGAANAPVGPGGGAGRAAGGGGGGEADATAEVAGARMGATGTLGAAAGSLGSEGAVCMGGSVSAGAEDRFAASARFESWRRMAVEMMRIAPMTAARTDTLSTATVMSLRRRAGSSTGGGGYSIAVEPSVAELVALGISP